MPRLPFVLRIVALLGLLLYAPYTSAAPPPPDLTVEASVQSFLDAQPGVLKSYRDGEHSAAEVIQSASLYYGLSPRIILALLEATGALLSDPQPSAAALRRPLGPTGPEGFTLQIDWVARELRAGLGPYDRPPVVSFTDGTTVTLILAQAPEGVAMQRFLAKGRTQQLWRATVERFVQAFQRYFNNELPDQQHPQPSAVAGFLQRPWPAGVRVVHLAYFDHIFPTVDTGQRGNGFVVNFFGRGSVQYDGHDAHDFYFPDTPIGTHILAAADGVAYARTHRGNGVVILHPGGYETIYWHLDKFASIFKGRIDTDRGVQVRAGDLLGSSGMTGFTKGTPHLHFEVRHNGREVDPYGWYGPGADPCARYVACEASVWLWAPNLVGEFDFTPPDVALPDQQPPIAKLTVNPSPDLRFLARFDGDPLQQVGAGTPTLAGALAYAPARFGAGVQLADSDRLAYPVAGNLDLEAGTIAFWAQLPKSYPANSTGRHYLLTASADPDGAPVYTGTLALRHDLLGPGGVPRWDFWTTPESGQAGRDDLVVSDTLAAGLHHFAITWSRAERSKQLYLDGQLAAAHGDVELPVDVGEAIELNRFSSGFGFGGVVIDELAIFGRVLAAREIAQLAAADAPLGAGPQRIADADLLLDLNALDDAGGIVRVQFGVDGVFGDPLPYDDQYALRLPSAHLLPGRSYTIAARLFDRADNSTTVSTTVTIAPSPQPLVNLSSSTDLGVMLNFSAPPEPGIEFEVSASPDFDGASWQPLPERFFWIWHFGAAHIVWLRFRDAEGLTSPPLLVGTSVSHVYLPFLTQP